LGTGDWGLNNSALTTQYPVLSTQYPLSTPRVPTLLSGGAKITRYLRLTNQIFSAREKKSTRSFRSLPDGYDCRGARNVCECHHQRS